MGDRSYRGLVKEAPSDFRVRTKIYTDPQIFKDEILRYREGVTEEDLAFTRGALIRSNARRFETLGALRGMLNQIGTYDLPFDYIKEREGVVRDMTLERHRELARMYINPDGMIYLVVGDAATQLERLAQLGFGIPILLDRTGRPTQAVP